MESGVEFKREWASDLVKYSMSDLEFQMSSIVNESVNLNKLETHFFHKQKVSKLYMMKDPAKYDFQKSLMLH